MRTGEIPSHPAKFSLRQLAVMSRYLKPGWKVLDPFAGVGTVHRLRRMASVYTTGVEIQPRWAAASPYTMCADVLEVSFDDNEFNAVVTSPTFGNRYADHHTPRDSSVRRSYQHDYGEPLEPHNSGLLQWGQSYRDFHEQVWKRILPWWSDRLIIEVKDHIRDGKLQRVVDWHQDCLLSLGLQSVARVPVPARGMRFGANLTSVLCESEVLVFEKEASVEGLGVEDAAQGEPL